VKIGDLVKMEGPYHDNIDLWGIGVVVKLEKSAFYDSSPRSTISAAVVAVVYWSEQGRLSWDEDFQLEVISENR